MRMRQTILIGCIFVCGWMGLVPLHFASAEHVDDGIQVSEQDWPWWRGPDRNGTAHPDQDVPLTWNDSTNIAWKTEVPGRGHSSPTVAGDRIYLATCDEAKGAQSVLCYDRDSGTQLWQT